MLEFLFDFYKGKSKRISARTPEDLEKAPEYITEYELLNQLLELKMAHENVWVVIVGLNNYHGTEPFNEGLKVHLVKEPGNFYDPYAIMAICDGVGKCGYIADSKETVRPYTLLAELLHGGMDDSCMAEVIALERDYIICRVDLEYSELIFNYGVNFYRENKFSNAMMFFEAIENEYPRVELLQRMAMCYLHYSNFTKALEYIKVAENMDDNNPLTKRIKVEINNKMNVG